ncbi:hypothetical protein F5B17DRAFT_397964 [Nemania serpens]|nr:hypothetical protein F5B17DRAFT_397964 [Nemania serpens]
MPACCLYLFTFTLLWVLTRKFQTYSDNTMYILTKGRYTMKQIVPVHGISHFCMVGLSCWPSFLRRRATSDLSISISTTPNNTFRSPMFSLARRSRPRLLLGIFCDLRGCGCNPTRDDGGVVYGDRIYLPRRSGYVDQVHSFTGSTYDSNLPYTIEVLDR